MEMTRRKFAVNAATAFALGWEALSAEGTRSDNAQAQERQESYIHKPVYATDLSRSSHALLRPLPLNAISLKSGFWAQRIATNLSATIPEVLQQEVTNDRVFNFQRMKGTDHSKLSTDLHSLRHGADSEVYKWLEGASWVLLSPNPGLRSKLDQVAHDVVSAQEPNGYLNTYFVGDRIRDRMLPETQIVGHEVYCIGHLTQAGIACYRVTGDRTLLDAALRFVDGYVLAQFGSEIDRKPLMSGHPGPEMMFIELYRETGEVRYLRLAEYLLRGDQRIPVRPDQASYYFAGTPFTERTRMEGHAVRAVYACCGAADYAIETGDPQYVSTLKLLWDDMTDRQMYVTGGVGATIHNEAFGGDYVLPNQGSYCESCANIGVVQWAHRMLALTGEAKYGDVLERALYNSVNSGMAIDGVSFNYRNPLLHAPEIDPKVRRPFWYTNCCPPNLVRLFASLQSYFYSTSKDGIYVHLFDNSEMNWKLEDGTQVKISQRTGFPWDGLIDLGVDPRALSEFALFLRIPGWSANSYVTVNGAAVEQVTPGTYLAIRRTWSPGDRVRLSLDMSPQLISADPRVEATRNRIAVQRGPLVYCMEGIDQPDTATLDSFALKIEPDGLSRSKERIAQNLASEIVMITVPGVLHPDRTFPLRGQLYQTMRTSPFAIREVTINLIPYYAFANRNETAMQVWLPYTEAQNPS